MLRDKSVYMLYVKLICFYELMKSNDKFTLLGFLNFVKL